jgi:nucleoside-diphosphate-sugar epimerase
MKNKPKVIITGAAGEVGFHLIPLLLDTYSIICIDKNKNNLGLLKKLFPGIHAVHADLAESGSWEKLFKDADCVVQLQAQISSPHFGPYQRNNIDSVKHVVEVCQRYQIKNLVHASSSVVISIAKDDYTRTKRMGEEFVKNSGVPYTILRPTLMYGCFDIKHLGYLISMFEKSPVFPMPGSGKYIRQPLYVEDFCRIIVSCMRMKPRNKIYNITGKEKIYLIDCLKIIFKEKHKHIAFVNIPLPIFKGLIGLYGLFNRKTRIVPDQLTALTAGDIFPVIAWDKIFHVKPTAYVAGVRKMLHSPYYKYQKEMKRGDI